MSWNAPGERQDVVIAAGRRPPAAPSSRPTVTRSVAEGAAEDRLIRTITFVEPGPTALKRL